MKKKLEITEITQHRNTTQEIIKNSQEIARHHKQSNKHTSNQTNNGKTSKQTNKHTQAHISIFLMSHCHADRNTRNPKKSSENT